MIHNIVCHLGDPRTSKPATLREYGKLREVMIQRPWVSLPEHEFINLVTQQGTPFYGALLNGRDLMELQYEKLCWRTQQLVGLDFDVCHISGDDMQKHFQYLGLNPWLGYYTFSNNSSNGGQSYRLLWRTETDLNLKYEDVTAAVKSMRRMSGNLADKHAANPTRMWQGTNSGFFHYDSQGVRLNLREMSRVYESATTL